MVKGTQLLSVFSLCVGDGGVLLLLLKADAISIHIQPS